MVPYECDRIGCKRNYPTRLPEDVFEYKPLDWGFCKWGVHEVMLCPKHLKEYENVLRGSEFRFSDFYSEPQGPYTLTQILEGRHKR